MPPSLDLFPIGNCAASALIDRAGRLVWACTPRVDGDPLFSALLGGEAPAHGFWSVEVEDLASVRQTYLRNTPVLSTEITDKSGAVVQVIDFCPRYRQFGRVYRPMSFVRLVRAISGTPHIRILMRPTVNWGEAPSEITTGSNHLRYVGGATVVRLTTDAAVGHIANERLFRLEEPIAMVVGPDEGFDADIAATTERMLHETLAYWRGWVRTLSVPLEWQEAVIRSAITLKLCAHEETGAIVAALTTSVPEHAESGRNWDYRYCWLRDAYYVVQALNRLGAADLLENYLVYLRNLTDRSRGGHVQNPPWWNASRRTCRAIAAWVLSGSATRRTSTCSTTSTARSSCPASRPSSTNACCAPPPSTISEPWSRSATAPSPCTTSPTPASGSSGAARRCTPIRR
jgi:GH15 family glucan-1,4-alpha-glucosidase